MASIPAGHPYVRSVVDVDEVTLLEDPTPVGATLPGQWWPPRLLDPGYARRHLAGVDVMHVHFGFDTNSPEELAELVGVLSRRRVPLILTVHDLHNPHFADVREHRRRLDVLVPAARVVFTLTDGAAAQIADHWQRTARVLPHPAVLPLEVVGSPRPKRSVPVVAVHGKDLRDNVDPWPVLEALTGGGTSDVRVRFDLDHEALTGRRGAETRAERLAGLRRAGVDVRVHPRFTDAQLVGYLAEIDVLVLPYRFGTHSGWVEACHDAGVVAVVPDCGQFHRQHPYPVFGFGADRFDPAGLRRAVDAAISASRMASDAGPGAGAERRRRRVEQRRVVRAALTSTYRRAAAAGAA